MTKSSSSAVIEFAGNPASGKSTIARGLEDDLTATALPANNRTYSVTHQTESDLTRYGIIIKLALIALIRHPIQSTKILWLLCRTNQRSYVDLLKLSVYALYLRTIYSRSSATTEIEILDQGLFQLLWSILLTGSDCDRTVLYRLLDQFPSPTTHIVVFVETDGTKVVSRLQQRNTNESRLEEIARDRDTNAAEICDEVAGKVARIIETFSRRDCSICTLTIDTEDATVDEAIQAVSEEVTRYQR
ncbi:AAA family ATPase [Natronococcus occultus]|uniref:Thymidylate kinase n=1 Tax=Natronococcus occultus SP4 TaxID=694430 RepID=L0K0D2_9EURY|nr:AAA family ATPase [Natronococcus occultus]AGB38757.1 hypothetical protein Natoc_3003 [Natronococcus occultus SP4]